MKKIIAWFLIVLFLLCVGCDKMPADTEKPAETTSQEEVDFTKNENDLFTDRDTREDYDETEGIRIELRGDTAVASSNTVKVDGTTVTITADATHIINGTLTNGQIIVDAPDTAKLQLVLDNVEITSETSAPLYIKEADKVFVTLVGENVLTAGESFVAIDENNIDGAIYSKQDLTFNGDGSLVVTSPAGHGIVCKDDLVLTSGTYTVSAASHALDANDSIRIKDIVLNVTAGKDGLHAENKDDTTLGFIHITSGMFNITAEGDGISAGNYLQIENGNIEILAGGGYQNGEQHSSGGWGGFPGGGGYPGGGRPRNTIDDASTSMKGLKAGNSILIENGTFHIDSADDAIHSNISLTISGGIFEIASGDDAIHAEENLTVSAGDINITKSYEGLEALHIHVSGGNIKLTATDDGLNAAGGTDQSGTGGRDNMFGGGFPGGGNSGGSIVISGGTLYINSSGDGMDANGTLEITGGHTTVVGPTSGDTATLDYDKTGTITGGTFIGTGSSMMAQTFSDATQGVIALSVGTQAAGTKITITDKNGNVLVSHEPELSYQIVIISTPELRQGETYTVSVGSHSGDFEA